MATISTIPVEMMGEIFGFLQLVDLIRASWICRHWRRLALHHHSFWSDIRIDSVTHSALFWARQRLIYADTRPFRLVIDYPGRHHRVERDLLDLVCAKLGTVRELHITLDSFYAISVFETLLNEAEALEVFRLHFILGPGGELFELEHLPLPSGIFGGNSPCLHTVSLENVILTHITPIPAFKTVKSVAVTYGESVRYRFPEYLFDYFPSMTWLSLSSGSLIFNDAHSPTCLSRFSSLRYLDLAFSGNCVLDFFRRVATAEIAELCVVNPTDDVVYAVLEPLRTPFHMLCQMVHPRDCVRELRVTVWSPTTGLIRHFAEDPCNYALESDNGPLTLFENEDFAQQISSLTLATPVWALLLPVLPSYGMLRDLRIWIDYWDLLPVGLPVEPLRVPQLEMLLLEAVSGDVQLASDTVVSFIQRMTSRRIQLYLCHVSMIGDSSLLEELTLGIRHQERNEFSQFQYNA